MTSIEKPQAPEDFDFFNDTPQKAKEETPKTSSQLVVDTKLKQTETQQAPISASTAGTALTQSVQSSEKVVVVEKVTAQNVSEVRSELHRLQDKIDSVLHRNRSLSPTIFHKVSYKTSSPVETYKKSYGITNVPFTTSVYTTESSLHHIKNDAHLDSFESVALKARAVARAKEYLLEQSNKKRSTTASTTSTYTSTSTYDASSSLSKFIYSKPVDIKPSVSSLYKSSIITSAPRYLITETHTGYREKVIPIEVPTYKTYTFYKPAKLETVYTSSYKPVTYTSTWTPATYTTSTYDLSKSTASIRTEKSRTSASSACKHCGHELTQKQTVNNREEREVKSRPQREVEEQERSDARTVGKRREILDERKQRSSEFVRKTPYEQQSNRDPLTKERAQEILKQDEQNIKDFDFKKNKAQ